MIKGVLALELSARQGEYNSRFHAMRRVYPGLHAAEFSFFLAEDAQPVADAASMHGGRTPREICEALYDFGIEALGSRMFSAAAGLRGLWRNIMLSYIRYFIVDPVSFPRIAANAIYNLSLTSYNSAAAWEKTLVSLAGHAGNKEELLDYGKALAWRCGLAHYRDSALDLIKKFQPPVQRIILGIPEIVAGNELASVLNSLEGDPWFHPQDHPLPAGGAARHLEMVSSAGGFRGFGGPFISPPLVETVEGRIVAYDGKLSFIISADIYGTTLTKVDPSLLAGGGPVCRGTINSAGAAEFGGLKGDFHELAGASSFACSTFTMAVTIPESHHLFLIAVRSHAR